MNAMTPGGLAADAGGLILGPIGAVEVRLSVEVGAARMTVAALAGLAPGATLELDKRIDEHVDILVNEQLFARGEVVPMGDRFGVKLLELVPMAPVRPVS